MFSNKFFIFCSLMVATILLLNTAEIVDAKKNKIIIGNFGGHKKHTTYIPYPIPIPIPMGGHDQHYHHTTYHHDGGHYGGHGGY